MFANIGVDTAKSEPLQMLMNIQFSIPIFVHSPPYPQSILARRVDRLIYVVMVDLGSAGRMIVVGRSGGSSWIWYMLIAVVHGHLRAQTDMDEKLLMIPEQTQPKLDQGGRLDHLNINLAF